VLKRFLSPVDVSRDVQWLDVVKLRHPLLLTAGRGVVRTAPGTAHREAAAFVPVCRDASYDAVKWMPIASKAEFGANKVAAPPMLAPRFC
jgi:hypothetical protein